MRPELAAIRCSPAPVPRTFARRLAVRAAATRSRTVVCPEPPWLVLPPSPPENPFSGHVDLHVSSTDIPLSIRMVQMKKRRVTAPGVEVDDALGKAVSALELMIGELQRSVMANPSAQAVLERISRDRRDSLLWLLRRVFFTSPELVLSLLLLLAEFVSFSAQKAGAAVYAEERSLACAGLGKDMAVELAPDRAAECPAPEPDRPSSFLCWFDIGVKEGPLAPPSHCDEDSSVERRQRAYERTIAEGETNSMILSNYAQFLYRIANDHDRAEQYFQWAVMAEPRDAEAMSRYAAFLWEERGDITGAEEMFLEAIETEPWNPHHSSTYAWFLWKTGALDTCYPLPLPSLPEA